MLFDEEELFRVLDESGARVLLIGRRAMVVLGLPVLTADYDLWLHADDIEKLNAAVVDLDLFPNRPPDAARKMGRYVLENDEHVDVLIASRVSTREEPPDHVHFDEVWSRRQIVSYVNDLGVAVPSIQDLIRTKRFGMRRKDVIDIGMLEALAKETP